MSLGVGCNYFLSLILNKQRTTKTENRIGNQVLLFREGGMLLR